tara:strand:+ start:400 stop:780 length:381 start_codon:yes stop_codon:yes gene_type:complete
MKYLSYLEICAGFGGTIGNLLAGILYEKIDYMYTMVVFFAIMFIAYLVSLTLIPNELNQTVTEEELETYEELEQEINEEKDNALKEKPVEKIKLGWGSLLSQKESVFSLMCLGCGYYSIVFSGAWL